MTYQPQTPEAALPDRLTEKELARRWRVSTRTLQRWRAAGTGPPWYKIGARIIYGGAEIRAHEDARKTTGADA